MSRRRRDQYDDFSLPWELEIPFWVIALVCVPIAMWWFTNEITSPAEMLGTMLGVTVDARGIVESAQPLIWIFGLIVGVRVRFWLLRIVVDQLKKAG